MLGVEFESGEVEGVLGQLDKFGGSEREGVRLVVSECFGGLMACTSGDVVVSRMTSLVRANAGKGNEECKDKDDETAWRNDDEASFVTCTVLNGLRCYISSRSLDVKAAVPVMREVSTERRNNDVQASLDSKSTSRVTFCCTAKTNRIGRACEARSARENANLVATLLIASLTPSLTVAQFLVGLKDENLSVLEMALKLVTTSLHHNYRLCKGLLASDILPVVHECSRRKIIREIDLGPFKHKIDDGLVIRKEVSKIYSTLLEHCPHHLDLPTFFPILAYMLGDDEDVRLTSHAILTALAKSNGSEVVSSIELFIDPLVKVANKKIKDR